MKARRAGRKDRRIRVFIVDDREDVRYALTHHINVASDMLVVGVYDRNDPGLLELVERKHPHVVIVDLVLGPIRPEERKHHPEWDGIAAIDAIRRRFQYRVGIVARSHWDLLRREATDHGADWLAATGRLEDLHNVIRAVFEKRGELELLLLCRTTEFAVRLRGNREWGGRSRLSADAFRFLEYLARERSEQKSDWVRPEPDSTTTWELSATSIWSNLCGRRREKHLYRTNVLSGWAHKINRVKRGVVETPDVGRRRSSGKPRRFYSLNARITRVVFDPPLEPTL